MTPMNKQALLENLIAAMTSGLEQRGAQYRLPETLALEYGRLCYNQAIKDVITLLRLSQLGQEGSDLMDRVQGLHLFQREEKK
jgi:hypothetical protein